MPAGSAAPIVDEWTERGAWPQHRQRSLHDYYIRAPTAQRVGRPIMRRVNYPEAVSVAAVLATNCWTNLAISDRPGERDLHRRGSPEDSTFPSNDHSGMDPLTCWQESLAITRRRQAALAHLALGGRSSRWRTPWLNRHDLRMSDQSRPVVLVTGVGRTVGIGAGIALRLAHDGWDVATSHWGPYDDRMPWDRQDSDVETVICSLREAGAKAIAVSADLERTDAPRELFDAVETQFGPVTALVMAHCESVNSDLMETSIESFDRHFAVNARSSWLLITEFVARYRCQPGAGRIIALTSDATVGNLPYGASKGALDRIVIAAAKELSHLRITANVINPGPIDTGWMTPDQLAEVISANPRGRVGRPSDTAALVAYLCSPDGEWINGQLLHSDGGLSS